MKQYTEQIKTKIIVTIARKTEQKLLFQINLILNFYRHAIQLKHFFFHFSFCGGQHGILIENNKNIRK